MKIGEKVRHSSRPDVGVGEIRKYYSDGCVDAEFSSATFTGIDSEDVYSVEKEEEELIHDAEVR